jgi:hypothetical protein
MIYAAPSSTFEAVAAGMPTGLTGTIGVRIRDNQGADTLARTTAGIAEDIAGSGIYRATLTAPATQGQYTIVWDTGGASPDFATESLEVTSSIPVLATGPLYVSATELKATLTMQTETFANDDIAVAVEAASRVVDALCGRRFYADATANSVRHYRPVNSSGIVPIDDLVTLTQIASDPNGDGTYDDVWVVNTDYVLAPANAEDEGIPYTQVRINPRGRFGVPENASWFAQAFPGGWHQAGIQVTGKFGWPAVPARVKQITSILAHRFLRRSREAPFGILPAGIEQEAMRISRTDPDLMLLLTGLARGGGATGMGIT